MSGISGIGGYRRYRSRRIPPMIGQTQRREQQRPRNIILRDHIAQIRLRKLHRGVLV